MHFTIYRITCNTTGKIYIGKHQTKDLEDSYMGSGKFLAHAKKKYGLQNFSKDILHIFDTEEEMNTKEAELVTEEFCLREDTYNICPGGKGGWGFNNTPEGQKLREFSYSKRSEAGKKKFKYLYENDESFKLKMNKIWNENISKATQRSMENNPNGTFYGKKHSDETKKIIGLKNSDKQKGSGNSQFGTIWITNGTENKKIKKTDSIPEGYRKGRKIN